MKAFRAIFGASLVKQTSYSGPTVPTAQRMSSRLDGSAGADEQQTAYFANGCFWGTEHMFTKSFEGKLNSIAVGYIGGKKENPSYREVCSGRTGHAEAVKIDFDPSQVSYAELVEFHYRMHDPTQVNGQGNDRGTQYRSAIFTTSDEQKETADKVTLEIQEKYFDPKNKTIATIIEPAGQWYTAEEYHQKYLELNPGGYECSSHYLHW